MISSEFRALLLKVDDRPTRVPVMVRALYDSDDPLAVTLIFNYDDEDSSPWTVSYELLEAALKTEMHVGGGDVRFRQDIPQGRLYVCLRSKTGHADVALPLDFVKDFMTQTEDDYIGAQDGIPQQIDEVLEEILNAG